MAVASGTSSLAWLSYSPLFPTPNLKLAQPAARGGAPREHSAAAMSTGNAAHASEDVPEVPLPARRPAVALSTVRGAILTARGISLS